MLSLLRKHQKIVFATAGLLVIFSMCFFGVASQGDRGAERPNVVLGRALDGSKVNSNEVFEMVHFLNNASNPHFGLISSEDDVIMNSVFKSGLASMLIDSYYDEMKEELDSKLEVYSKYKPYAHPEVQFVNAEMIWSFAAPELSDALKNFKQESDPHKQLRHVINAYCAQTEFPEFALRNTLYKYQQQFGAKYQDPYILRGNLSLFNARSPYELLGSNFMNLTAQFIQNAAIYAKQKGHKVSIEEAKASLIEHSVRAYKELHPTEQFDGAKAGESYKLAFKKLMVPEKKVIQMWQKVLLFNRLFEEADGSVFLDTLAYDQINQFTKESLELNVYSLPQTLVVDNFEKMMKLELYLDNVSKRSHDQLVMIPEQFHSVERVKSRCPQLLAKKFELEVNQVARSEVALQVGLKELFEYEVLCFNELKTKFPALALKEATTTEEKLEVLDGLEPLVKTKLDDYVKEQIIAQNESWIYSALDKEKGQTLSVVLNIDDVNTVFEGFEDNNQVIAKFEKALLDAKRNESAAVVQLIGAGDVFYSVKVLSAQEEYEVLSFEQALSIGALDRLLDERLAREYPIVRVAHAVTFKNASGEFKPLSEVREDVGRFVFSESITQLQNYLKDESNTPHENLNALDQLATYRMHHFLTNALTSIRENSKVDHYVLNDEVVDGLEGQFKLQSEKQVVSRSEPTQLLDEQLFRMKQGEWSNISVLPSLGLGFFHVDSKKLDDTMRKKAMQEGHALLVEEARRVVLKDVLSEIESRHAIHFDKQVEESA
ncbi:MAG: hypothetical protein P0S95_01965 [Rhabdochlamydiaceae bacterium]|nr:hypothetical protein [Candidatus Amphrikana amoebophyrae]